jgi:hypothetical protein
MIAAFDYSKRNLKYILVNASIMAADENGLFFGIASDGWITRELQQKRWPADASCAFPQNSQHRSVRKIAASGARSNMQPVARS